MDDDAERPRPQVDRRDGALLVGEEAHARGPARHLGDGADEAVRGDDRRVDADAVIRAGGDDDLLLERRGGTGDHLGRDAFVVGRERGGVAVLEQALEDDVLLQGRLVLDHLLLEQLVLGAQLLVLGARVEEVLRPAIRVAERPRDPLDGDLERLQRARDGALRVVQRPVGALAERDGDQREREQDEQPQHDPAPEGTGAAGGKRTRGGTPDGEAQHRRSCGAVAWHGAAQSSALPAAARGGLRP